MAHEEINEINPQTASDMEAKEKFDIGLSDEEIVAQILSWETESEDFYSQLKRIWTQNLEYYKGIQTDVLKIQGRQSRAVENRIWMATEQMIPIATSRLPEIVVKSGAEDEQAQIDAADLQDILGFHLERVSFQEKAEQFLRDMIVKRYGVFKVLWDTETDDVGLRLVDPRRVRVPRHGRTVDDLAWILEELEMSYPRAVEFFGEEAAKKLLASGKKDSETKIRKRTFTVTEAWTNEFVAWVSGNIVLKKQKNPFFDFKNLERNFFLSARKPYIIKSVFTTEEGIIGETDYIQQTIPIQDNINIRKRQTENIIGKVSNPPLLIDSDVMTEEQAANITNEEGIIIYGKGAADGTKIRFETPGQVSNALFQDLEFSRAQFDNIWGIHSTTRGEREGRETLGGRMLLKQADLGRIDGVSRQLERAIDEIAEWWTQLIKLFYTEERSFSILGEDGLRFIKAFTGDNVSPDVRPMVTTGSTLPKDEIALRQEALELWQLKGVGIKTLYKRLKMPNIGEAIDDYIQTQSGAILQQGLMAAQANMQAAAGGVMPQQGQPAQEPGMASIAKAQKQLLQP